MLTLFLLLSVVLQACADDEGSRQFANDERDEGVASSTSLPPTAAAPPVGGPVEVASPIAASDLLLPRGEASRSALAHNGEAFYFDVGPGTIESIWPPNEGYVWDARVSPDGEEIGLLISSGDSLASWELVLTDLAGSVVERSTLVGDVDSLTSADVVASGVGSLSWSTDGGLIAVTLPTGGIYEMTRSGDVRQMTSPGRLSIPGYVSWSAEGGAIAFTGTNQPDTGSGVSIASTGAVPLDPVELLRPDATGNRSAGEVAWPVPGESVYALVERLEMGSAKGDIMGFDATNGTARLEWSSGAVGSGDGARSFSVSPDGRVLAILAGASAGESRLVVKAIESDAIHVFRLPADLTHAEISWTDLGVLVLGAPESPNKDAQPKVEAFLISTEGEVSTLAQYPAPVVAPVASPAASPIASPLASPQATPEAAGSPEAEG